MKIHEKYSTRQYIVLTIYQGKKVDLCTFSSKNPLSAVSHPLLKEVDSICSKRFSFFKIDEVTDFINLYKL